MTIDRRIAVAAVLLAAFTVPACGRVPPNGPFAGAVQRSSYPSELRVLDLGTPGSGAEAQNVNVTVNYIGWLADGTEIDNFYTRGAPFSFMLGTGQVIPG